MADLNGFPSPLARFEHVLQLRREGRTYQEIADRLGVKPSRAQRLVSKAIHAVLREPAEEVRQLELSRIEILIKTIWDAAIRDAEKPDPDYRKFDRLKALIETKLRWCGAQPVVESLIDNRVQIVIQHYTRPGVAAPPPAIEGPATPDMGQAGDPDLGHAVGAADEG